MPENKIETRGGARPNAGRKKGSSAYGETTKAIRVPESLVPAIKNLLDNRKLQFEQLANSSTAIFFPTKTPAKISLPLFCACETELISSPAMSKINGAVSLNVISFCLVDACRCIRIY